MDFPGETEEDFEETLGGSAESPLRQRIYLYLFQAHRNTGGSDGKPGTGRSGQRTVSTACSQEVQAISAQVCGRDVHTVQEVLVEEPDSHVEGLVTGRMSNNTIVHFPGGKELIGKIVKVYLGGISKGFYYMGSLVD